MKLKQLFFVIALFVNYSLFFSQEGSHSTAPVSNHNNSFPEAFRDFKAKLYVGGSFGGWLGSTTYLNISPLIGYKVTDNLSVGGGVTYNYYRQTYGLQKVESTIYGTNTFARYMILENLFAQVGWDRLSVADYRTGILNDRTWINNVLIGGGYKQMFTEKGSFIAMIFYNVNQTPLSPYPNPIFQMGFNLGL